MIKVRVNGKTYTAFTQLDITRSMDELSGEARIMVTEQPDAQSFIVVQDLIDIYLDGIQVTSGYAEKISDSESSDSHSISFRIRDKVADLIDNSVPSDLKSKAIEKIKKYSELCQLVIDGLGLNNDVKVIDNIGATINSKDIKAAEIGATAYNYLKEYARKVQVFLNTDGKGNLLLRNKYTKLKTILANVPGFDRNNIESSNIDLDYSNRYHTYVIRSNDSLASKGKKSRNLNNYGTAIDSEIRSTRYFEKVAESPMTEEECKRAASEEANIRRIRSFNYSCVVAGFSANSELWSPGNLVTIKDIKKGVVGEFLIRKVSWSFSAAGDITKMDITYPDAYQAVAIPSTLTDKKTKAGTTYSVVKGDNLTFIAQRYNISLKRLVNANPQIKNINLIEPGDKINIPVKEV